MTKLKYALQHILFESKSSANLAHEQTACHNTSTECIYVCNCLQQISRTLLPTPPPYACIKVRIDMKFSYQKGSHIFIHAIMMASNLKGVATQTDILWLQKLYSKHTNHHTNVLKRMDDPPLKYYNYKK